MLLGMVAYTDLKQIALTRFEEAKILRDNGYYDGAIYLCGYVVETALKARICKHLKQTHYPDTGPHNNVFAVHDFDRLLMLSGLENHISLSNPRMRTLWRNWSIVTSWKPNFRYTPIGSATLADADDVIKALEARGSGFLTWIQTKW